MDPNLPVWGGHRMRNENPNRPFLREERVLVYFQQLLYKGKVIQSQRSHFGDGFHWRYFVHYVGWRDNWDEWVNPQRILRMNDENDELRIQKKADLQMGRNWECGEPAHPQNRLADWIHTDRAALEERYNVVIPRSLYVAWTVDRDLSLHLGQISEVPTLGRTLRQILMDDFMLHLVEIEGPQVLEDEEREDALQVFVDWFNDFSHLLCYKSETETVLPEGVVAADAYGLPHLLRILFANVTEGAVQEANEPPGQVQVLAMLGNILQQFDDFQLLLDFLEANQRQLA